MSRQNDYSARRLRRRQAVDNGLVLNLVLQERRMQPRHDARKLLHLVSGELVANGVAIGRARSFELLREENLLLAPKPGRPRATNSRHSLPVFHNLIVPDPLF